MTEIIDEYAINRYSVTAPRGEIVVVDCFSKNGTVTVGRIIFLEDGAANEKNQKNDTGVPCIYYPYKRYNDILATLEKGNAVFSIDINDPSMWCISTERIAIKGLSVP